MSDPAGLRDSYQRGHLGDDDVAATWIDQLRDWFEQAVADPLVLEPNAIQLATADAHGRPGVRTVLVKAMSDDGIVFYTNYDSAKGRDLAANPQASAVFVWLAHQRQVRLTGAVRRVDRATTGAYFDSRPRGSRLGAWASPQSQVVTSRVELDERLASIERRFPDGPVPAPPEWGGFLLEPDEVEFWQGRPDRMHDRIRLRRDGGEWVRERLAP